MSELYVLNVPEFWPVIDEGARCADRHRVVGNYVEFSCDGPLIIDRKKAGARPAVWFSSIGALRHGKVIRFDSDLLHIVPE
jgi:hypothetical protein